METRLPARPLIVLTFATGVIDAASFLALGQVFAAMQTGNVISRAALRRSRPATPPTA